MLNSITLCSDCDRVMVNYDLYEFFCKRTKMVLGMEEKLCLNCGSKILTSLSLLPLSSYECIFSRSESIEISVDEDRLDKIMDEDLLYNLVINSYKNVLTNFCSSVTDATWYRGYEIDLWETLNGISSTFKLNPLQKSYFIDLYKNIKLWIIDPDYWAGYGTFDSPFVPLKKWEKLYEKHKNKEKQSNE